jgi:hypothetical protein
LRRGGYAISTIGYAVISPSQKAARPRASTAEGSPLISRYLEIVAGLVPAEVLAVHAVAVSVMFTSQKSGDSVVTVMTHPTELRAIFFILCGLSLFLYVGARLFPRNRWERFDFGRMFIPPLAFLCWTMLQRSTAFDAVWPGLDSALRTMAAVILAVILAAVAQWLAKPD